MKVVEKVKATATLAAYTEDVGNGPVVVTDQGKPVAVLLSIENADLETVALSTNRQFIDLVERSRARVRAEGAVSSEEMRRRFGKK
jgi:PHD/YefM family antitoxin component YafN of YafNO toxin-antitoxin module